MLRSVAILVVAAALLFGAKEAFAAPTPPAVEAKMPKNWRIWVAMGRCEQPGKGAWGVRWSHRGPSYMGGLGFYYRTWLGWKPKHYPANAGDATWRQQMNVANRVARDVGFSAWSCWARIR